MKKILALLLFCLSCSASPSSKLTFEQSAQKLSAVFHHIQEVFNIDNGTETTTINTEVYGKNISNDYYGFYTIEPRLVQSLNASDYYVASDTDYVYNDEVYAHSKKYHNEQYDADGNIREAITKELIKTKLRDGLGLFESDITLTNGANIITGVLVESGASEDFDIYSLINFNWDADIVDMQTIGIKSIIANNLVCYYVYYRNLEKWWDWAKHDEEQGAKFVNLLNSTGSIEVYYDYFNKGSYKTTSRLLKLPYLGSKFDLSLSDVINDFIMTHKTAARYFDNKVTYEIKPKADYISITSKKISLKYYSSTNKIIGTIFGMRIDANIAVGNITGIVEVKGDPYNFSVNINSGIGYIGEVRF